MKRLSITALLMLCFGLITACNTVEGAGRDVESVGDAVADAAADCKDDGGCDDDD
ncbi:MAG: entericidin A/B family lipoprotein [Xanthomonadaceae bacterium]|nr:entericidin A/B family lipoprotein [Xanthomonadaceae bacterium]